MELLRWFKEDFFSWVDCPKCEACGGETRRLEKNLQPTQQEAADGARNIEG